MRRRLACLLASAALLGPTLADARPSGGFDLHDDVRPAAHPAPASHPTTAHTTSDRTTVDDRHANVTNVRTNDVHVSTTKHVTVVDPRYGSRPAWSWNHGVAWAPSGHEWGGGFWGPFALGAAAAVAGAVAYGVFVNAEHHSVTSYRIRSGTPGATLLNAYGLQQVPCGPAGLVVILGPNSSVVCAQPNSRVAAGEYSVTPATLTLVSA